MGDVGRVTLHPLKDQTGKQTKIQGAAAQAAFQIDSMDVANSKGSRWSDPELPHVGRRLRQPHRISWRS